LLREAGGEEHYAFNSTTAQLIFGAASFLSPLVYSYLVLNLERRSADANALITTLAKLVPEDIPWISLYWLFAVIALVMVGVVSVSRIPKVDRKADERVGALDTHVMLLRNPTVLLFFVGIFAYVGLEQGVANWISKFLQTYHGVNPQVEGATVVSHFWGLMTAGCLLGLLLLKLFDCRRVLIAFAVAALACLTAALLGSAGVSMLAFKLFGFCLSVMWSIVFSLALNSLAEHHGTFSGILCTGIIGGAFVPMLVGQLGNLFGLRVGLLLVYVTLAYILSIGFWARPLVNNATVPFRDLVPAAARALFKGQRGGEQK
jgi:fucose permease